MAHPFSAAGKPLPAGIRTELDRILASELFLRSDRLSAFLRFVVEETLKGDGAALKEHVIAMELYGKGADFNTAADPIVRVDARRLRDKLREYYASSPPGAVIISVPKGSYTPVFEPGDPALAFHPPPSAPQITADPRSDCRRSTIALALGGRGGDCRRADRRIGDVAGARSSQCPSPPAHGHVVSGIGGRPDSVT